MKVTNNAEAALQRPGTRAISKVMTPELREKYSRVCGLVVDLLKANSDDPAEAYMILQFTMHGFEDTFGIRGGVIVEKEDPKH